MPQAVGLRPLLHPLSYPRRACPVSTWKTVFEFMPHRFKYLAPHLFPEPKSHICSPASPLRHLIGILNSTHPKTYLSFTLILKLFFLQSYSTSGMVTPFQLFRPKTLRVPFDSMSLALPKKPNPKSLPLLSTTDITTFIRVTITYPVGLQLQSSLNVAVRAPLLKHSVKSCNSSVQNPLVVPHPPQPQRLNMVCTFPLLVPLYSHSLCSTLMHCIPATTVSARSWTFNAYSCQAAFVLAIPSAQQFFLQIYT